VQITKEQLMGMLRDAWFDGFGHSGEGCNGEYLYGDHGQDPRNDADLQAAFDHFYQTLTEGA
jgi:hypothetical protein